MKIGEFWRSIWRRSTEAEREESSNKADAFAAGRADSFVAPGGEAPVNWVPSQQDEKPKY